MRYVAAVFLALVFGQPAHALVNNQAQNRVHVGGAWTPGNAQVQLGFDSRLTNSIFVNVGAFVAPGDPTDPGGSNPWVLRHGVYVDPGIRIPHRDKGTVKWDVIARGGFGPVWVVDADSRFEGQFNPALNWGADFLLRYKTLGLRIEGRVWHMKPFSKFEQTEDYTMRPQIGSSLLYEF